jgi:hypothetical protein
MAFVDVGVAAAAAFGAEGIGTVAAGAIGSGLVGMGTGALMAGIQGKNVLNGALMGGALGAVGGGIGGAFMGGGADATGMIGDSINSMARAGATTEEITQSLMDTYGFTANQAADAINASVGSTVGGINMAAANAADQAAGITSNIAGSAPVGASQAAVQGAKQAMTTPPSSSLIPGVSNTNLLKYGVPAAMVAYGTGMFGNNVQNQGVTQQSTVGQSKPVSGIMGAQLGPNYKPYFQAKEGGIAKLATGGTGEASMTPDVTQSNYNPADVNAAKATSLSASTQALLNQYGISPTLAQQGLSALQSQGIGTRTAAKGGVMKYSLGGELEGALPWNQAQAIINNPTQAAIGANTPFETAVWNKATNSYMRPTTDMYGSVINYPTNNAAEGGIMGLAHGGSTEYNLGSYSDGGRLLKGAGDGMSDEIPATIAHKQPARLAEGEFVVPADVVSHLGNGSTDAGAKHLYKMMNEVRKARTGKVKQAKEIKADKFIPK